MAELYHDDNETRESWLRWKHEFMRRGLRPVDLIEVHGPHSPPADLQWGCARCEVIGRRYPEDDVGFRSYGRVRSRWETRNIRFRSENQKRDVYKIKKRSELPSEWKAEMQAVLKELEELRGS